MSPAPRSTANPAPPRPGGSVRRTTSIDVTWPDGGDGQRLFVGVARDLWTPVAGEPGLTLAQARIEVRMTRDKTITSITADPEIPGIDRLVGARAGGHLRALLREVISDLAHPVYLLLDDLSGAALVSVFAWLQWHPDKAAQHTTPPVDVCWGLKEGNSAVRPGPGPGLASADAGALRNPLDPEGWHAFPSHEGAHFRRARRIDVMHEPAGDGTGGVIRIDSAFQDSGARPGGGRVAVHEYLLRAQADSATLEVLSIEPEARILPFPECPGAIPNARRLVGRNLALIRDEVLALLRGTAGCTHLNDALRALADVPVLAARLG